MIIKFDHITHVVTRGNTDLMLKYYLGKGYEELFRERGVKNSHEKKFLMRYDQTDHDIYFLKAPLKGVDVELIAYDKIFCDSEKRIELKDNYVIEVKTCYTNIVRIIFDVLGVKKSDSMYVWGGVLQQSDYRLNIVQEETAPKNFLDDEGVGCITLMIDSLEKVQRKLMETKLDYSEKFSICINQQILDVMFVYTPNRDVIIEIISKQ